MSEESRFELKPLSSEAVATALERAMRYRLLNEPAEAESICQDILRTDPDNQEALITWLLAITDQFGRGRGVGVAQAREILPRLATEYEQCYYEGLICERRAKAYLNQHMPGAGFSAYERLRDAMDWYEKAEVLRPAGNEEALLRWNTCARLIMRQDLKPRPDHPNHLPLE